jgi:UDP-N-acetylglucosamine 2-epimerase
MERIEAVLVSERPDLVIVPGDVNSTLAVALVVAKLPIRLAHLESGLRSFDRTMPEAINRIVADEFSDLLFLHSQEAVENLRRPVTIQAGTNTLLGLDPARIVEIPMLLAAPSTAATVPPPLWDGRAAERVPDVVAALSTGSQQQVERDMRSCS